ncbi:MAG: aminotransferase class I/II-fold pyridoxal phosphate-dependent enzyme, partial [Cyclobacteriaceae bacterium]
EESIAMLEGGKVGVAFGSGMAAIAAIFQSLKPGQNVLIPDDVYFAVRVLFEKVLSDWGLERRIVDMSNLAAVRNAIDESTALVYLESPSNPQLKISDIKTIAEICKESGVLCAVDNTWPTPVLMRPLELGADVVVHSTSKYFGGHSDLIGGAVVIKEEGELSDKIKNIQQLVGGVPSPFDCWLTCRGIQTLSLRVKAQSNSAMKIAKALEAHPRIEKVLYPGLESHLGHEIAKSQILDGFGGMLSILVKTDSKGTVKIGHDLKLFTSASSLGGVESLVEHRKSVEGESSPTPDNLLRLSIGLEHPDDLLEDLSSSLSKF